jgi:hypothetical protein
MVPSPDGRGRTASEGKPGLLGRLRPAPRSRANRWNDSHGQFPLFGLMPQANTLAKPQETKVEIYSMARSSQPVSSSQNANSQNAKRDEVLKRMLKMKPQPHGKKTDRLSQQLNFNAAEDYSEPNISHGNKES